MKPIKMHHPDSGGQMTVPNHRAANSWKDRGWIMEGTGEGDVAPPEEDDEGEVAPPEDDDEGEPEEE